MNENKSSIPEATLEYGYAKCDDCDIVTVPRTEYDKLVSARFGIHMIGSSLDRYGADKDVVNAVCKQFGYEYKETPDA